MEHARELGHARSIGVSNFGGDELRQVLAVAAVPPVVDQVQFSPYEYRRALLDSCRGSGIALEAYSPLGTGRHLRSETVAQIAQRHGRTPAQVLLRWCIERGIPVIPKSTHRERLAENAELFDFALAGEDIATLRRADRTGGTDRASSTSGERLTAWSSLRAAIDEVSSRDPVLADLVARVGPIRHRPRSGGAVRCLACDRLPAARRCRGPGDLRPGAPTVGETLTPEALNAVSDAELRAAGFLRQQARLSATFGQGSRRDSRSSRTSRRSDEELVERLTAVRGIGRWTAEMY
jgi:hypothetical protein